jgi:AraC-like DNA-binding protein
VSNPGDVRVGPILAIPAVLSELGVTPQRAFSRAGVDPGLFRDPDGRIAIEALGRLLESCVALTNCSHFGLLVGERFDLQGLGPLGYLMRNSATVGDALRSLLLHLHLHDRGAAPILLVPDSARVILGYSVYHHAARAIDQIYDGAIAIAYKILRELCGPSWSPLCVQFAHNPPQNMAPYRRLFRSRVSFDAEVSGIVLSPDWLQRPIENADATLHGILTKALQQTEANSPTSFAEQVQGVLHQMILSGNASAVSIAALFQISERTLRRRLEAEGKHLKQLVNEARFELARQLLSNTRLPVSEIAAALQFRDPNAFSRAFHGWATISPTLWRARQADSLD